MDITELLTARFDEEEEDAHRRPRLAALLAESRAMFRRGDPIP